MTNNTGVIIDDVLKTALLGLTLAAEVFVKNPAHQVEAGNALTALNTLIQAIGTEINPQTPPSTPAS